MNGFHESDAAECREQILSLSTRFAYRWEMDASPDPHRSRQRTRLRRLGLRVCLAAALLSAALAPRPTSADDARERYFQGLRERRLFSVAEGYCLRRLSDPGLSMSSRVELTIELSRTLGEHATYRTGQEREELWRQARDVVEDLLAVHPADPRANQLELQAAVVTALHGSALRWQVELAPYDDRLRDDALLQLQSAVTQLETVEPRLREQAARYRELTPAERADGGPTRGELRKLAREAQFRTALAYLDLGRVLPSGLERTAALHAANERFLDIGRSGNRDQLSQLSRLYRAEIARRQHDSGAARALLDALELEAQPGFDDEILAERVRVELDQSRADLALRQLLDFSKAHGPLSGELAALNVEALLQAWEAAVAAGESELATDLMSEAERIDATINGPWRVRSRTLLDTAADTARYGSELANGIRAAQAAYRSGDAAQAAEQYALAVQQARDSNQNALGRELQLTRSSILLQSGRFAEAAEGFQSVADGSDDTEQAGDADLLYAYCLGKQWEQQRSAEHRSAYIAALEEHRERFASRSSSQEATWMLASVLDAGNEWEAAIARYGELPPDHPRAGQARARIAVLYERQLESLRDASQPTSEWEDRAVEDLTGFLDYFPVPPARLDPSQAEIAVRLARILLDHRRPRYADADALLQRVQQSRDIAAREAEQSRQTLDPAWSELSLAATRLQIVALAGQQRTSEARRLLNSLSQAGPGELLAMLSGLADISQNTGEQVRRELADLQIQAADRLMEQRDQLDAESQWLLDETRAEAYVARNRPHDALIVYQAMLRQQPRNRDLVRTCAELLASTGDVQELRQAYDYWKRLVNLEQQGSRGWLEARYELAACGLELGRPEEARKLVGVTKLLYPELGGADLKARYLDLEGRIADADTTTAP